ncbi:MAG: hypothetical protein IOC82_09140 [Aestuariivirga sp.]|uniref:hypothetical protein n=1 Tax=Aestuariivirga sp. TaxID=2650926 RepID=UPI0025BFF675|nr:hypothetical protein [Aestuariivirga sp.]MCA3561174.1 hypothetical protein [Aestuariivirga sp.]
MQGLIDFGHVGLLGHSRGGEGMRAALARYRDLKSPWPKRIGPVNFEALFEIGPVDGQTARTLDAEGVAWNVLLPGCDGDVYDLQGVRPFDRMIMRSAEKQVLPKSSFEVFGANHNFYNTEWQVSDAGECAGHTPLFPPYPGSAPQRSTAENTVIPFFRAHVGAVKLGALADRFDPSRPLPPELTEIAAYARGHTANLRRVANFVIDDFRGKTGRSSRGVANTPYRLTQYMHSGAGPSHDRSQRAALVGWSTPDAYLQVNASRMPLRVNTAAFKALEFRVKLECHDSLCDQKMNPAGDVDFSVRLVTGAGNPSAPVKLSSVALVYRPVSAIPAPDNSVFQTVRIPLSAFGGADMSQFRGVRFVFDETPSGLVSLGNVRLVRAEAPLSTAPPRTAAGSVPAASRALPPAWENNQVVAVRPAVPESATRSGAGQAGVVEIELASTRRFPVMDSLPTLYIGDRAFRWSRFVAGAANRIVFSLDEAEFRQLPDVSDMRLVIGGAPVWNFGQFRRP